MIRLRGSIQRMRPEGRSETMAEEQITFSGGSMGEVGSHGLRRKRAFSPGDGLRMSLVQPGSDRAWKAADLNAAFGIGDLC